ncbi:Seven transmembrane protein 1 [Giardia lamblia P15]|uniref:Seven transmembrane protein 1 n=1 Tax=Giardia intestinalis (strain P15) TaxID=658858 RepID=E1F7I8_GIAIA|nr:Seven transmembrane protein 1 [Giardia lamblia P15]
MCYCAPLSDGTPANPFAAAVFDDCVYSAHELVSVIFGWISIVCWFTASYPQIRLSLLLKRAECISSVLLFLWVSGDISNFSSLIILRQPLTQIIMGGLWLFLDSTMTIVTLYYKRKHKGKQLPKIDVKSMGRVRKSEAVIYIVFFAGCLSSFVCYSIPVTTYIQRVPQMFSECAVSPELSHTSARYIVGSVLAYITLPLYCFSGLLQVIKNCKTKATDDLSPSFFAIIFTANATQTISLFTFSQEWEYLLRTIPYIIAAIFPMMMDFTILIQIRYYNSRHRKLHNETEGNLSFQNCNEIGSSPTGSDIKADGLADPLVP